MPPTIEPPALRDKIQSAPKSPGCYLFYDSRGVIIYVGKSKLLHHRVRQYFTAAAATEERTKNLVREIRDVTFQTTTTDLNALMLEYRLIKEHRPWFNAQHKRDTRWAYLRIAVKAPFPTLSIAPAMADDGAAYYGMFSDPYDVQEAIDLLSEAYQTPRCAQARFPAQHRGCVYFDMHCPAPV